MTKESPLSLGDVSHLVNEAYIPFTDIERAIPWPTDLSNWENDAEHSFSVALVSGSVADRLGLDSAKATSFGLIHDFVERFAGDTSIWDEKLSTTKESREKAALEKVKEYFSKFPWIYETICEYESMASEEARLVYALDKLLATLMIVRSEGHFWKTEKISYQQHLQKYEVVRNKIAKHAIVLAWYEELIDHIDTNREKYFNL